MKRDDEILKEAEQAELDGAYEQVLALIGPLVERGELEAHCRMAVLYRWGRGVEESPEKMVWHLERAVAGGYPWAMFELGTLLGPAVESAPAPMSRIVKDPTRAAQLLEGAAAGFEKLRARGDGRAMSWLASMYEMGLGVEQDCAKAILYYEEAFREGHFGVANHLAQAYTSPFAPELRDVEKAYRWYCEMKRHDCQCICIDAFEERWAREHGGKKESVAGCVPTKFTTVEDTTVEGEG